MAPPRAMPMGAGDSAARAADLLLEVYLAYRDQFDLVTRRAAARFESQDWSGGQRDAHERLVLYSQFVRWVRRDVESLLGDHATDQETWAAVKRCYAALTLGRPDSEIARTFFNSISRRICATVGVNPRIEFLDEEYHSDATAGELELLRYDRTGDTEAVIGRLLADLPLRSRYEDEARDVARAAAALEREVAGPIASVEVLPTVFYRNKAAYVVGRVVTRGGGSVLPLALALVQRPGGMVIDAVLTSRDEIGVVFGFTRSYFHVDAPQPAAVVRFLGSILGAKRRHELYTAIGFNRHGKSELYRTLRAELKGGQCHLEPAEGEPGLVMTVFRLPGLQVVFKVIRDRFGAPKRTTRRAVREKYQLVFVRDRVGRLADAQEFEHLEFRRSWFAPELLSELEREASRSVQVEGDRVIIRHLYTEREVEPLNVYLRRVPLAEAKRVIVGYGNAIRDLAAANIFTGDMLLKNFGVTRHGRVIFYDYDELCLLTDCRFRRVPQPAHPDDELAAEPWFHVADADVFPEQFRPFLVPPGPLGEVFLGAHAELLTMKFWTEIQARQQKGEVVEFFPYPAWKRLGARS